MIITQVRLVEGMYPVFMADWLRVWPREQLFLMRYEDYGGHERERIAEVIKFLGLCECTCFCTCCFTCLLVYFIVRVFGCDGLFWLVSSVWLACSFGVK